MIFTEIAREMERSGVGTKDIFTILTEISASLDRLDGGDLRASLMKLVVCCIAAIEHIDREGPQED
jgi:hypothetical protein